MEIKDTMIIEYDENDFKVVYEEEINEVTYRIVKYSNGYYGLQKLDNLTWETLVIHPNNKNILLESGLGYIQNRGENILGDILEDKRNTFKLANGEYYEVKLYLDEDCEEEFNEIVKKEEFDNLMDKISAYYEVYRIRKLEAIDEDMKRREKQNNLFIILGFIIIVLCFIAVMNLIRLLLI